MARTRSRARSRKTLGDVIADVVDAYGLRPALLEMRALMAWDGAVGERIARRARPSKLANGILYIRVTSSPWLAELSFLKEEMARKVNQAVGTDVVREVRLHTGVLPTGERAEDGVGFVPPPTPKTPPKVRYREADLPRETLRRIDSELEAVADPDIRDALRTIRHKLGG